MDLSKKLGDKTAVIGVVGLGYVGLPLAVEFCRKGFRVHGFELDGARLKAARAGRSYIPDVPSAELSRAVRRGRLRVSDRFDALSSCDAVLICVQTPLSKSREPDISRIVAAVKEVSGRLKRGRLVILESTTFPGTTAEVVQPLLERGGRRLGRDFYLAFSPERVDPGNKAFGIANTPKVVGGCDRESGRLACEVYAQIVSEVVPVSSATAAELVKLLENSYRAVNIALVNEMAQICHRLGLDVWEVIGAAATKPFGFMPFYPGPGIGGHCIPKDPQFLAWKMKTLNFDPRFIQLASVVNGAMPRFAADRIAEVLNRDKKPLKGSRVLILGVAYKPGVGDYRESPALDVMELLLEAGASVSYHDPHVPRLRLGARAFASAPLNAGTLRAADCVAVLTAHPDLDYAWVAKTARRLFDARNATRGLSARSVTRL